MTTKHVPELFVDGHSVKRADGSIYAVADTNAIALKIVSDHAAHPKLVAALRILARATERQPNALQFASERYQATALLRELGETS